LERVAIIGGGPSGSVCALSLLKEGGSHPLEVVIFDKKPFSHYGPLGCNMCAGLISHSVLETLDSLGVPVPANVIQRKIEKHFFETRWGGVSFENAPGAMLYTAYRGMGPLDPRGDEGTGFDHFLLNSAVKRGARHIKEMVTSLEIPSQPTRPIRVRYGDHRVMDAHVVVVACGVNSSFPQVLQGLNFGYIPPVTFHACQAEIPLDEGEVNLWFDNSVKVFSLGLKGISLGAITPKKRFVTVTVLGSHVRRADLERFLLNPIVTRHFPPHWELPTQYCHCHPKVAISTAKNPVTHRLLVVGDAFISRYLKNGIESALYTGTKAARAILEGKVSREELIRHYVRPCRERYHRDNYYGKLLFKTHDMIAKHRWLVVPRLHMISKEAKKERWEEKTETQVLWHLFTGSAPYKSIFLRAFTSFAKSFAKEYFLMVKRILKRDSMEEE